ncbi:unnamed protein product [Camellia sinensis]
MGVPAYLQLDLEADLVLPPAPAGRVDNQNNSKNTRSDHNVVKGARAARIQQNKWIENPKNGNVFKVTGQRLKPVLENFPHEEERNPVVAEATLDFRNLNKRKLLTNFPTFLPQKFEKSFLSVFPALMSLGSFVQLFPSLVDLPISVILWRMTWAWR